MHNPMDIPTPIVDEPIFTIYTKSNCPNCVEYKKLLEYDNLATCTVDCDSYLNENRPAFKDFMITMICNSPRITIPYLDQTDVKVLTVQDKLNAYSKKYDRNYLMKSLSFPIVFYNGSYISSPLSFLQDFNDYMKELNVDDYDERDTF